MELLLCLVSVEIGLISEGVDINGVVQTQGVYVGVSCLEYIGLMSHELLKNKSILRLTALIIDILLII